MYLWTYLIYVYGSSPNSFYISQEIIVIQFEEFPNTKVVNLSKKTVGT